MPFALGAMLVAAHGFPPARIVALIVLSMVFARTAAMTFNRLADWELDKRNPRTAGRHKLLPRPVAIAMLCISSIAFVAATWWINPICFRLSPLALVIVFFYSLTKRFTSGAQFFLGLALAVAPVGAWLAVTGAFALPPLVLATGVICWLAGFDIIYACMDYEVDRKEGLKSMVVLLGIPGALRCAEILHTAMFILLIAFGFAAKLGPTYYTSLAFVLGALVYEHRVAKKLDVDSINKAFFQSNAFVSIVFVAGICADRLL